jgi:bifunctional N-acetylglucosamine-1-phosphate-uridyltransferase/glucosamine-1-phosphate-acetyltransferase GlmU-like protein
MKMQTDNIQEYIYITDIVEKFKCSIGDVILICMNEGQMVSLNEKFYLTDDEDLKLLNIIETKLNEKI